MRHLNLRLQGLAAAVWLTAVSVSALGCGADDATVVFITVDARDEVRLATDLQVSITNDGTDLNQEFSLSGEAFPVTFTITPTNREGSLLLDINAFDQTDDPAVLRARGTGEATIVPDGQVDVQVMLEPSDFVINSTIDGEQTPTFPTASDEPSGRQIAVLPDGSFLATFVQDCNEGRCDVIARRFHPDTSPALNAVTGDNNQFVVNPTAETTQVETPSVASSTSGSLVAWTSGDQVLAVLLGLEAGRITQTELMVSDGMNPAKDAHVTALPNGDFLIVWRETLAPNNHLIRGRFVNDSGELDSAPIAISIANGKAYVLPVAAGGDNGREAVIVWHDGENLFGRFMDINGALITMNDAQLTQYGGVAFLYGHHVTWVDGAAMAVWGAFGDGDLDNGSLFMRRFAGPNGTPDGAEALLVPFTADDFGPPAIAARDDGIVVVSWHNCGAVGDDSGCGVFFQAAHPSGLHLGPVTTANTTRLNDQRYPSVAASSEAFLLTWRDESGEAPDTQMSAVRGRAIYTTAGVANGKLGAPCDEGARACDAGLACMTGAEAEPLCHTVCDPAEAEPCPTGGICTTLSGLSGCLF